MTGGAWVGWPNSPFAQTLFNCRDVTTWWRWLMRRSPQVQVNLDLVALALLVIQIWHLLH